MIDNITELYDVAGIKEKYCGWLDMGDFLDTQYEYVMCDTLEEWQDTVEFSRTSYSADENNNDWRKAEIKYPPFTAEKQLELIKLVSNFKVYETVKHKGGKWFMCASIGCNDYCESRDEHFSQALAGLILRLWDKLTDTQKEEIKEILE